MKYTLAIALVFNAILPVAGYEKERKHIDAFFPPQGGDSRIAKEVRHELITLPYYGVFDDLAFDVNGSTVTLMGAVSRPSLKPDAEKAVKSIEGVTEVVNDIEILPPS